MILGFNEEDLMIVGLSACTRNELRKDIIDKWDHDKDQHE